MPIGNPQTIKERVDVLERTLLAINCFSNICSAASSSGSGTDLEQSDVAYLLDYLSESSLYKVEALRMMIDQQEAEEKQAGQAPAAVAPPTGDRRRKKAPLAAVA